MIVSAEDNEEMLRALVSKPFLDLAVIMYIRLDDILQIGGEATVKVSKEMLSSLNVSEEEAYDAAMNNMKSDGYNVQDIFTVIRCMIDEDIPDDVNREKMFVMTNADKRYGAAGLLDINNIVMGLGITNCYILPSSIHETLLVPATSNMNVSMLKNMVLEVNESTVSREEKLSDNVYLYNCETGNLSIAV